MYSCEDLLMAFDLLLMTTKLLFDDSAYRLSL